jgi:ATP-dependent RNA helicase HelY
MSGQDQLSPAEAYAAAKARAKYSVTQEFIDSFDFGFDDFQIEACQALEDGHGVLVADCRCHLTLIGMQSGVQALQQVLEVEHR